MQRKPVALRERGRLVALFHTVLHQAQPDARQAPGWDEPDRRNVRTWRQFILAVVVAHTTRLITLGRMLLGQRAAQSVKAVVMGLAYFLRVADFPVATLSPHVLVAAERQLDPAQVATYRGKACWRSTRPSTPSAAAGGGRARIARPA